MANSYKSLQQELKEDYERLSVFESESETSKKQLSLKIQLYTIIAWLLVAIGIVFFLFGFVDTFYFYDQEIIELNHLGDYVGGVVASLWSLAGLLFIYIAFLGQREQIINQQLELRFSRYEMKSTRLEMLGQVEQMKKQHELMGHQRFENTFFQLIRQQQEIINGIDIGESSTGRDCFKIFYRRLQSQHPQSRELDSVNKSYLRFIKDRNNDADLGHYFRHLYHIVKFVDANSNNPKTYTNFIRAQLSSYELLMLFYNCISEYGRDKFKPLIEKYSLLKNMPKDSVFNTDHLNFYKDKAYK